MKTNIRFKTHDEYIKCFPNKIRILLKDLRKAIKQAVPEAQEVISYNMPAFKYYGILVYYAAHKEHIGFYPGAQIINEIFTDDLKVYETTKGTIRFPLDRNIPVRLVKRLVKYKAMLNFEKAKMKKKN